MTGPTSDEYRNTFTLTIKNRVQYVPGINANNCLRVAVLSEKEVIYANYLLRSMEKY